MRVTFYGVRGSFPVAHPRVAGVGGNTSCVALRAEGAPTVIFDAGTGLRRLSKELVHEGFGDGAGEAILLTSHTHWDHIQGFMHFAPFYTPGNQFTICARANHDRRLRQVFEGQAARPYFGYGLERFQSKIAWKAVTEGTTFEIGPYTIRTVRLNHPGVAVGYRVEHEGKAFVYMTDTAPYSQQLLGEGFHERKLETDPERIALLKQYGQELEAFVEGADVLLYDTFFTQEQYEENPHWGHSTAEEGIRLARQGGVERLVLYHHHPEAWDDVLEGRRDEQQNKHAGSDVKVGLAREREWLEL